MFKFLLLLCSSLALFAQTLSISADSAVYVMDVSARGVSIVNMFNYLVGTAPYAPSNPNYQIGIQTTSGFLYPVQSIVPATNSTILIINYGVNKNLLSQTTVPVFVEQIIELVYNINSFTSSQSFSPGTPSNTIPYYYINPSQRIVDIQSTFNTLNSGQYLRGNSQVSIQTTLTGTFYSVSVANGSISSSGLITNVKSVSVAQTGNSLFLVGYPNITNNPAYVVLEPDQVSSIIYTPNAN